MHAIQSAFRHLRISTKRVLIAQGDTEGCSYRSKNGNGLWNMNIIFRHVVDEKTFENVKQIYHVNHIVLDNKHQTKPNVKKSWKIFNAVNDDLMKMYDCESLILCFWNAPHDRAVLKQYGIHYEMIDLLRYMRVNVPLSSYTLRNVCKHYKIQALPTHTAYSDSKAQMLLLDSMNIKLASLRKFII